jgi:hypothetical protein
VWLEVRRFAVLYAAVMSELYLDGEFVAFGIEDTEQHGGIPVGTFPLQVTYSPKFHTQLPLILVPGRSGIRVHSGNTVADVSGCVMAVTSLSIAEGKVFGSQSKTALAKLLECIGGRKEGVCEVTFKGGL